MHQLPESPVLTFPRGTPRRAAIRALGVAATLTGAFAVGAGSTPVKRSRATKKRGKKRLPVVLRAEAYFDHERVVSAKVGQTTVEVVVCPTGAIATGGGYSLAGLVGGVPTVSVLSLGKMGNGWHIKVIRMVAPANPNDLTIQASVVCAATI
jgi:hypothetical protein